MTSHHSRRKRILLDKINHLGSTEHLEILKILEEYSISCTSNNNGVFFNLTSITNDCLKKIEDFVLYCSENKQELDEYDKKLQECKYRNNIDNIVKTYDIDSGIKEPSNIKNDWKEFIEKSDISTNIKDFIDKLESIADKTHNKRVNSKFTLAKKKYGKKLNSETEIKDVLVEEMFDEIYLKN